MGSKNKGYTTRGWYVGIIMGGRKLSECCAGNLKLTGRVGLTAPVDLKTSLWFYAGLEGEGDISLHSEEDFLVSWSHSDYKL